MDACDRRGWSLLHHRFRSPFAEIDLLFRASVGVRMVEVKTLGSPGFLEHRIARRQRTRLLHARTHLESRLRAPVGLDLVVVTHDSGVEWIPDFLS